MLLLGAGGLGSPTALYLAAAGVGTIGIYRTEPAAAEAGAPRPRWRGEGDQFVHAWEDRFVVVGRDLRPQPCPQVPPADRHVRHPPFDRRGSIRLRNRLSERSEGEPRTCFCLAG